MAKRISHSVATDRAWKAFSRFIRLRDCLETTGTPNMGRCFTCPNVKPFPLLDAGHFIPRGASYILFNEQNVHAQCKSCNGFWEGEQAKYQEHLLEKYGQDLVDYLWSHKHTERKYPIFELLELEEHYKLKVKQIMSSLP